MVTCKDCKSINVDFKNLDFAKAKPEGFPATKYTGRHDSFYCFDCQSQWKSGPEDWKLYYEYQALIPKTTSVAYTMPANGSYQVQDMGTISDYQKRKDLAKKLVLSYKHLLNLESVIWHDIEQNSI